MIALLTLVASFTTFAVSEVSSWTEIRNAVRSNADLKITGDYAFVGQIVSAFDVCTDGENFVTTKKFPFYRFERRNGSRNGDDYRRVLVGHRYLSYPLETVRYETRCSGSRDNRCRRVAVDFVQSTVKEISVEKLVRYAGRHNDRPVYKTVFKKTYEVPACN